VSDFRDVGDLDYARVATRISETGSPISEESLRNSGVSDSQIRE
jgi:hypothetical protein